MLRPLHESRVGEEEIDHLGHLNVRYYGERAAHASAALAESLGLGVEACRALGGCLDLRQTFTRHYREQMVGAPLVVAGGVLGAGPEGLRFYHELHNSERDERAATFVHDLALRDRKTRAPLPLPETVVESVGANTLDWPAHGRPRTLDLDRVPTGLTLAEARARGLAVRRERIVPRELCDADGFFPSAGFNELVWGGEPMNVEKDWMPLYETADGGSFGWATLESRGVVLEPPPAGARIQSFGAEVELGRKTSLRHHWVFELDRGALLITTSIVNLAFDLRARRAIEIPPAVRATLEAAAQPDLR